MTLVFQNHVRRLVFQSQTTPGVTFETVVGGNGGASVPSARLLPTPLGDPGQIPTPDGAGGVEWADQTGSTAPARLVPTPLGDPHQVLVVAAAGESTEFVTSVDLAANAILLTASLTPAVDDQVFMLARWPGAAQQDPQQVNEATTIDIPAGFQTITSFTWSGSYSPQIPQNVLVMLPGDVWPSKYCSVDPTDGHFVPLNVPGFARISVGCGSAEGTDENTLWIGWNNEDWLGQTSRTEPATSFRPLVVPSDDVLLRQFGPGFTGHLSGKLRLAEAMGVLDELDTSRRWRFTTAAVDGTTHTNIEVDDNGVPIHDAVFIPPTDSRAIINLGDQAAEGTEILMVGSFNPGLGNANGWSAFYPISVAGCLGDLLSLFSLGSFDFSGPNAQTPVFGVDSTPVPVPLDQDFGDAMTFGAYLAAQLAEAGVTQVNTPVVPQSDTQFVAIFQSPTTGDSSSVEVLDPGTGALAAVLTELTAVPGHDVFYVGLGRSKFGSGEHYGVPGGPPSNETHSNPDASFAFIHHIVKAVRRGGDWLCTHRMMRYDEMPTTWSGATDPDDVFDEPKPEDLKQTLLQIATRTRALETAPAGSGDVVGPASSVDGRAVEFDGTTGKLLKAAPLTGSGGRPRLDSDGTWADILIPSTIARDSEVDSKVAAAIDALLAGAPGALDTLDELAAAVNDDASFAASVTTALAGKVSTARTLAGLDLTSDRTAAELRTALGLGSAAQSASSAFAASSLTLAGLDLTTSRTAPALKTALGLAKSDVGLSAVDNLPVMGFGDLNPVWPNTTDGARAGSGVGTGTVASTVVTAVGLTLLKPATVSALQIWVSTGVASSRVGLAIYAAGADGRPGSLVYDAGYVATDTAGSKTLTLAANQSLAAGMYFLATTLNSGTAPSLYGAASGTSGNSIGQRGALGDNVIRSGHYYFATTGGAFTSSPTWLVATATGAIVANVRLVIASTP